MIRALVYRRSTKTITLTDEAYERLKAWKTGEDSFSRVVLRTVRKRGTFGDLNESFKALPPLSEEQSRIVGEVIASKNEQAGNEG
jgi:predicted CopG family antitoxin